MLLQLLPLEHASLVSSRVLENYYPPIDSPATRESYTNSRIPMSCASLAELQAPGFNERLALQEFFKHGW